MIPLPAKDQYHGSRRCGFSWESHGILKAVAPAGHRSSGAPMKTALVLVDGRHAVFRNPGHCDSARGAGLKLRFGVGHTLEEAGRSFNVTHERIHQIES